MERVKAYRRANPAQFLAYDQARISDERRAQKAASERKCRQSAHRKAVRRAERMKRIADIKQRTPVWADHEKIKAFYRLAVAFSDLYVPHEVDHILPLNGETVSGLHVESNLQVLTAEDNNRKNNRLAA